MIATRLVVLACVLSVAACGHPPTKEIAAAEQQVARAEAEGAQRYAPERYAEAVKALELSRRRLDQRDYQGSLSAANDAGESARLAIESIAPARESARNTAALAIGEVRTTLARVTEERQAAVKAGVSRRTLAPLDKKAEEIGLRVSAAAQQLELGNFDFVAEMANDLRTQVAPLPDLYRNARAQQETSRARPRARGTARRPSR